MTNILQVSSPRRYGRTKLVAHRQAWTFLCLTTEICTPLVLSIYFNKAIMIPPTTLMCHFEFYGYSNLAYQSRPPFLLGFSEQALSLVPPNACMGSTLYATGDRQVPLV